MLRARFMSDEFCVLVGWLKWFNAELSPTRYWRGPRSQEVGEEGDYA